MPLRFGCSGKKGFCETGKSMKGMDLGALQQDGCCNIAISLIEGLERYRLISTVDVYFGFASPPTLNLEPRL